MRREDRDRDTTEESLREERKYGIFWYSWLWHALRPVLVGLCVLVVVFGVVMMGWNYIDRHYLSAMDQNDQSPILFTVESGSSLTKVSNNLESQGLIHNKTVFKYYADFMGFGQKIQAGEYTLTRSMSMTRIAQQLTLGDGKPITRNITIVPGWGAEEIAAYLVAEGALESADAFLSLCRTGADYSAYYYISDVLASAGASARKYVLEGYLAADTYEVYTSATEDDIIRKLLSQTEAVFTETYHQRAEELGLTMDQALALASMIEKEAKTADFSKVSAVFHNRLKQNMTLGSDVTVKYISGVKRMSLTNADLAVDSPYNTYKYKGLPLGPICSPSPAAIKAALYPDETYLADNYLYFCSKDPDTGELYFSRTLAEHEAAVAIYAPLWQAYDEKSGD